MNTNESSNISKNTNTFNQGPAFNQTDAKAQLKKIGDQIEAIAKKWESQGSQVDCDGLYDLGNKVEHFLDQMDSKNASMNTASKTDIKSGSSYLNSTSSFDQDASLNKNAAFDRKSEDQKDRLS